MDELDVLHDVATRLEEAWIPFRRLPEQTQAEMLDLVEYLLTKTEQKPVRDQEQEWTRMSLASAMGGLEEESGPAYTDADLEERFSSS